jgi:NADPH-dependent 7-cyano-7-deazaguanine reductase QueF-like protein
MFPHPHLRVGSDQTLFLMLLTTFATAAIFVLTYAGVLLGRIPSLRLDRSGIALSGAALMFAVGTLIWNLWNSSWIEAGRCRFLF